MTIHKALIGAGFTFVGLCPVCHGRGWDYRLESLKAILKTDQHGNELVVIFDGLYNGMKVINKVAIAATVNQLFEEIGIKQTTTTDGN